MDSTSEASIDVQNLFFSYYSLEALHGISFRVHRGEMVGLLGPNGAGKSTTLKILAGILPTSRGKVHITGYALPELHLEAKKVIGYLPESPLLCSRDSRRDRIAAWTGSILFCQQNDTARLAISAHYSDTGMAPISHYLAHYPDARPWRPASVAFFQ